MADTFTFMSDKGSADRKAKVTPETKAEAQRLRHLWDTRAHPSQAEFGELYGIGNQSVMSQFLLGRTPLSLKAARGFAAGLGCHVEDFSSRLAEQAAAIANLVPRDRLSGEAAEIAAAIDALGPTERERVLLLVRQIIEIARHDADATDAGKKKRAR